MRAAVVAGALAFQERAVPRIARRLRRPPAAVAAGYERIGTVGPSEWPAYRLRAR